MKKTLLLIALFSFVAVTTLSYASSINSSDNVIVQCDDDPCEKCGKEECDGNCEAKEAKCEKSKAEKKACCKKAEKKACCKKATKECPKKQEEGKKE